MRSARSGGTLLPLIFAITLTGILGNTLIAPAVPDILDQFGVGDAGAGVLIAATSLPGVFLAPVIGVLADRHGRRRVLVPCLACYGAFGLMAAAAPSFQLLVLARLGMGIGAAGLINLAIVLIGDHWEGGDRTRLIGRNSVVLTIGLATLPPLGGALTDLVSWRLALLPYGLGLVTAVAAHRVLPADRPHGAPTLRQQLTGIAGLFRRPQLPVIFAGGMLSFVLIFGIFLAALPLHLEDEFGFGAGLRGVFLGLPAVPSMLVAFNLERIRSHVAAKTVLVAGAAMLTVGFTLMGAGSLAVLVVLGCIFHGLGEGGLIPTMQDVSVALAPPGQRGAVVALFVSATRLGQTIGPLGAAAVLDARGSFAALHLGALVALGMGMMFLLMPAGSRHPTIAPAGTDR